MTSPSLLQRRARCLRWRTVWGVGCGLCAPAARGRGRERSGEGRGQQREHRAERQHRRWYCTAVYCGRVGSRHFEALDIVRYRVLFKMSVPFHAADAVPEGTDVYCLHCEVKRLRRTENVRGTFEGVSAPREFAQPSPLSEHRTPYYRVGSRFVCCASHLRRVLPLDGLDIGRLVLRWRCMPFNPPLHRMVIFDKY